MFWFSNCQCRTLVSPLQAYSVWGLIFTGVQIAFNLFQRDIVETLCNLIVGSECSIFVKRIYDMLLWGCVDFKWSIIPIHPPVSNNMHSPRPASMFHESRPSSPSQTQQILRKRWHGGRAEPKSTVNPHWASHPCHRQEAIAKWSWYKYCAISPFTCFGIAVRSK